MKLFSSWSGGKDCMLALYRMLNNNRHEVLYLVNMCDQETHQSRSHGLISELIKKQAESIGVSILQKGTDFKDYENNLKQVISRLKIQGVEGGIFGDIYLQEHRDWIERVCSEMQVKSFFPLWKENTGELLEEFIDLGFRATIVSVRKDKMSKDWLGRKLDKDFMRDIIGTNIDPCAENGEYHTFVHDGPIFGQSVDIQPDGSRSDESHWFLKIN
ncbi:MAG: diphthine--ammonia ligase [Bacteroidales bacterium]